jgi:hypothetical protein
MSKQKKRLNELGKMKANQVSGDELLEFCRLSQKEKAVENPNDIAITLLETEIAIYMRKETKLSPKSIKNYTQAIRRIARDLVLWNIKKTNGIPIAYNLNGAYLRTCSSSRLEILGAHYFMIKEYRLQNEKGKGMYSAAFNHLIRCRVYQERQENHKRNDLLKTKILDECESKGMNRKHVESHLLVL